MADFTVSTDIDALLQSADNAAARASIGADVRTDANGAFSAGDLGGNARGSNAINIQASRSAVTQVASRGNCVTIGNNTTASGSYGYSTAVGFNAQAVGPFGLSTAIGCNTTASGDYSTASGSYATASGNYTTVSGYNATASGNRASAIGNRVKTTVNNTTEIGYWSGSSVRAGAIRVHGTGMVAQTIQNRATAYGDGGATKGSEADNTVIREGIALRRNGNEILVDLNISGTVTTLSLGTAS